MLKCKNCQYEIIGNFCSNCGHALKLERISWHYITHEIEHVLHFDKGIFFTIKELSIRPGETIRIFISENRSRLVKPIIFIIITSLIYSLIVQYFKINDAYIKIDNIMSSSTSLIFNWIQNHYGYANIITGFFIAVWIKLFFRKSQYNFFEILILLCFVIGIGMLIFAVLALIEGITKISVMQLAGIIAVLYITWAIGSFFEKRKIMSYIKAFFAYILGFLSFALAALALGGFMDLFIKS